MAESGNYDKCYDLAVDIAKKAGKMVSAVWGAEKNVMSKSTSVDLVTETDQAVEKMIFNSVREAFPDHSFIGEETVAAGVKTKFTDAPTWIIDPIDGTTNFVHSFPFSCISIAFTVNKKAEFGVIYNPILDDLYTARRGQGAYRNGKQIHVSKVTELSQALVMTEYGNNRELENLEIKISNIRKVLHKAHGIRSPGSAALCLCLVAQGSADAQYEFGIHCWDYAAGQIVVTEAGGVVMDTEGGELNLLARRIVAASHENVAREICDLLQTVPYQHDCQ